MRRRAQLGGDAAGQCGAQRGQPALILQQRPGFAGLGGERHHQPLIAGQAAFGVAIETGGDLDHEQLVAFQPGGFDAAIAGGLFEQEMLHRRLLHPPLRIGDKPLLQQRGYGLGVERGEDLLPVKDVHRRRP